MSVDRKARIRARAEGHVADGAFSGIEWAIEKSGALWETGRAGQADALAGRDMAEVPIYRIYSMTKPVTSAVAMMLVEEGRFRLADPVAAHLPEFAEARVLEDDGTLRRPRSIMTIEHLLTHRAGLSYGFLPGCLVAERYRQSLDTSSHRSLGDFVTAIARQPLAFDPGYAWRYSVATDVLARLIEVVEGKPLGAIFRDRVFDPLGLADTAFSVPEAEAHRIMGMFGEPDLDRVFEFSAGRQTLVPADVSLSYPHNNQDFARGGHGLFSTLPDYLKVARFLSNGQDAEGTRLLSRKGLEALWTNRIPWDQYPLHLGPTTLFGYGWGLAGRVMIHPGEALGLSSTGEHGWAGAASTYFWVDPVEDLIGVVLAQYMGSKIPLGDDMRNAVYQALD